jgi:hypothetical protein
MKKMRPPKVSEACPRCRGQGLTVWDAITTGFADAISRLFGGPSVPAVCKLCKGTGSR